MRYSNIFRFIGIGLFIYIILRIDISQLLFAFSKINWVYYLAGILFLIFWFLIRTLKWKRLIDSVGGSIAKRRLFEIMLSVTFLGVITPGKLGEFWRAKYLAESSSISKGAAFYTAFMDRLTDLLVTGVVAVLGLLIISLKFGIGAQWRSYILIFVVFLFLSFVFLKKIGLQKISQKFLKFFLPVFWQEKTDLFLSEFDGSFKKLKLGLFLEMIIYGFLYYLASIIIYYFIVLALGIAVPFWYLFLTVAMVWLILTLPISFFGLGVREAGFIYFFSILGVVPSLAVVFSLLALFTNILLAGPGAILFLWKK